GEEPAHVFCSVERVGAGQLVDGDAPGRPAIDFEQLAVTARAEFNAADVVNARDLSTGSAVGLEDDRLEGRGVGQGGRNGWGDLEILAGGSGWHADLTGGNVGVLLLDGVDHVLGYEATLVELIRVQPDPHAVFTHAEDHHVTHARKPRQLVTQLQSSK